jgi:WD40 repeat protein
MTVKLWDAENGRELWTFSGHSGAVTAVAFTPDGSKVLTGSPEDKSARVLGVKTGDQLKLLNLGETRGRLPY